MNNLQPFTGTIQLTYITGKKDGQTEVIKDGKLLVKGNIEIPLKEQNNKIFIEIPTHEPISINNREIIGTTEIRDGDIIQIDPESPLIRVRFTHSEKKSISQISADAKILAQKNKGSSSLLFVYYFFKQVFKYSTKFFRLILTLVILALLVLAYNQYQYLKSESEKMELANKEITEKTAELDEKSQNLDKEIKTIIGESHSLTDFSSVISKYSGSVGYIDVETGYINDDDWITYQDLFDKCTPVSDYDAYKDYYDELRVANSEYYFDLVWFGSGFLIDDSGTILSNRHVMSIEESLIEEFEYYGCDYEASDLSEYEFFARAIIAFPHDKSYYELEDIQYHEDYDIATAQAKNFDIGTKSVMELADDHMEYTVGEPIITLGYPSGIDFLVYKNSSSDSRSEELYDIVDSLSWSADRTELIKFILDEDLINSHVTRGIISQLTEEAVSFDSSIYGGNSGGPIIAGDGKILGIVTWKWGENETFNLGVSSKTILQEIDNLKKGIL